MAGMTTCSVQAIATHAHSSLALMGSGSGSRTAGSGSNSSSSSSPPIKTEPVQSPSTSASSTPVSPSVRRTPPVGLLNTCNLVQDEKLVVATLATLNSGDPSNIIKQDLRLIIQSRRKAEGKGS
ncbi:hypothetical protein C0Q70_14143 [Pomacea canaliculata]|uniref:Uncharacterized protein n=1 Tax=Pomacea canaliculata TaxID=400727 RepID=A0A2T7NZA0_POMCA|nr:hypothetical protein C0Q70_14143 [Pomacea canaliculata]